MPRVRAGGDVAGGGMSTTIGLKLSHVIYARLLSLFVMDSLWMLAQNKDTSLEPEWDFCARAPRIDAGMERLHYVCLLVSLLEGIKVYWNYWDLLETSIVSLVCYLCPKPPLRLRFPNSFSKVDVLFLDFLVDPPPPLYAPVETHIFFLYRW